MLPAKHLKLWLKQNDNLKPFPPFGRGGIKVVPSMKMEITGSEIDELGKTFMTINIKVVEATSAQYLIQ